MLTTGFWVAAALKRSVLPTIQAVSTPPPEPPVTKSLSGSAKPPAMAASTRRQVVIVAAGIGAVDLVRELLAVGG
jgi:hypothetical protein